MSARHCPTPTASWTNVIFPFGLATMSPIQFADSDPRATRSVMVATFSFFGAGSGFSEFMKLTNQYDRQSARSDGMSLAQTDCGKPRRSAARLFLLSRKPQFQEAFRPRRSWRIENSAVAAQEIAAIRLTIFPERFQSAPERSSLPFQAIRK